ncbi:hypothetical protein P7K49_000442 [Saguinus oedipus]|uniref:Secreted protein n=1 Tax=Saguinus oedipus TaxID=9490 RepID=A0ABQ9WBS9_SAGOE|nr:hypothetical protein P7K49_000442 [Saguinus oedipus]
MMSHQSRVTMILFVLELEWVLSTGQDKQFAWHCSESGQRLGGYRTSAVASGLQYPLLGKNLLSKVKKLRMTIVESCESSKLLIFERR